MTPGIRVNDLSFEDIVKTSHKKDFVCDAYGKRGLIFHPIQQYQVCPANQAIPASHDSLPYPQLQILSSMLLGPDKFVQRCAVTNSTGELAVLMFELDRQECLEAQYKGVRVVNRWVLHSIKGECACTAQPLEAHPSLSPDAVVLAQLHALRYRHNVAGFDCCDNAFHMRVFVLTIEHQSI